MSASLDHDGAPAPAANSVALGTTLELQWQAITELSPAWLDRRRRQLGGGGRRLDPEADALTLRIAWCPALGGGGSTNQRLAPIPWDDRAKGRGWSLPEAAVGRIHLTPAVVVALDSPSSVAALYVTLTLRPRWAAIKWSLVASLALNALLRDGPSSASRALALELPLRDHEDDDEVVGRARLCLRWRPPPSMGVDVDAPAAPSAIVSLDPEPRRLRLTLTDVTTRQALVEGFDVAIAAWSEARGRSSAARYPALTLPPSSLGSSAFAIVIDTFDTRTDVIRLSVTRCSERPGERGLPMAAARVALPPVQWREDMEPVVVQVDVLTGEGDDEGNGSNSSTWGTLTVRVQVETGCDPSTTPTTVTALEGTASASLGAVAPVVAAVEATSEIRGCVEITSLEMALIESTATATPTATTTMPTRQLAWQWRIAPGDWFEGGNAPIAQRVATRATVRAPVTWSARDRTLPTLSCELTLTEDATPSNSSTAARNYTSTNTSLALAPPLKGAAMVGKIRKGMVIERSSAVTATPPPPVKYRASWALEVPVLFAQAGEWAQITDILAIRALDDDDEDVKNKQRPGLRIRLSTCLRGMITAPGGNRGPSASTALPVLEAHDRVPSALVPSGPVAGLIAIANIHGTGVVFRNGDEDSTGFCVRLRCGGDTDASGDAGNETSAKRSHANGEVQWTEHVACAANGRDALPLVTLEVCRRGPPTLNGPAGPESDSPRTSRLQDGPIAVVGRVVVPVFTSLISSKHLWSFALPVSEVLSTTAPASQTMARRHQGRRRVGQLTFELQFVELQRAGHHHRRPVEARLTVHAIQPKGLFPSLCRSFVCQVAVIHAGSKGRGPDSEPKADSVQSSRVCSIPARAADGDSGDVLAGQEIAMSLGPVDAMRSASALVVRICDPHYQHRVLGQTRIPIRRGWAEALAREQGAWHRLYAVSSQDTTTGAPSDIGRLQVTVGEQEEPDEATADELTVVEAFNTDDQQESLLLLFTEVVEVVLEPPAATAVASDSTAPQEIRVRVGKAQQTAVSWSATGHWRWSGELLVARWRCPANDTVDVEGPALSIVSGDGAAVSRPTHLDPATCASLADGDGAVTDDWHVLEFADSSVPSLRRSFHVHTRTQATRVVEGELIVVLASVRALGAAAAIVPVSSVFVTCMFQQATTTTPTQPTLDELQGQRLRVPVRLDDRTRGAPVVLVQLRGLLGDHGELALAQAPLPLLPLVARGLLTRDPGAPPLRQWLSLCDSSAATADAPPRVIVVVEVHIAFRRRLRPLPSRSVTTAPDAPVAVAGDRAHPRHWQLTSAAVLGIWKKLFYLVDADGNGSIDWLEFRELYRRHAQVFSSTTDGRLLLRVVLGLGEGDTDEQLADADAQTRALTTLFQAMDTNGDRRIQWDEYVAFVERKLRAMAPPRVLAPEPESGDAMIPSTPPPAQQQHQQQEQQQQEEQEQSAVAVAVAPGGEMRRKRREDPQNTAIPSIAIDPVGVKDTSVRTRPPTTTPTVRRRPSRSPVTGAGVSSGSDPTGLLARLETAQVQLRLEQQRSQRLHEELAELQRRCRHLEMEAERRQLSEQARAQWMQEAIVEHERALGDRARLRARHQAASVVLQSKVRARLEQRRYQALRVLRATAATRLQCFVRRQLARRQLTELRAAARQQAMRLWAASRLQGFVRAHLRRRERELLRRARELSATVLQSHVRRRIAQRGHVRVRWAVGVLQRTLRRWLARAHARRLRCSRGLLRQVIGDWAIRWRWARRRQAARRLQGWWRDTQRRRWWAIEQLEAAICIQAMWRGARLRRQLVGSGTEAAAVEAVADEDDDDGGALETGRSQLPTALSEGGDVVELEGAETETERAAEDPATETTMTSKGGEAMTDDDGDDDDDDGDEATAGDLDVFGAPSMGDESLPPTEEASRALDDGNQLPTGGVGQAEAQPDVLGALMWMMEQLRDYANNADVAVARGHVEVRPLLVEAATPESPKSPRAVVASSSSASRDDDDDARKNGGADEIVVIEEIVRSLVTIVETIESLLDEVASVGRDGGGHEGTRNRETPETAPDERNGQEPTATASPINDDDPGKDSAEEPSSLPSESGSDALSPSTPSAKASHAPSSYVHPAQQELPPSGAQDDVRALLSEMLEMIEDAERRDLLGTRECLVMMAMEDHPTARARTIAEGKAEPHETEEVEDDRSDASPADTEAGPVIAHARQQTPGAVEVLDDDARPQVGALEPHGVHAAAPVARTESSEGSDPEFEDGGGGDHGDRESVDSDDLMFEADAVASFGTAGIRPARVDSPGPRRHERMDSERLLLDVQALTGDDASSEGQHQGNKMNEPEVAAIEL